MYHLMHGEYKPLCFPLSIEMNLITLVFLSLHSNGDNLCTFQYSAAAVTAVPTSAPTTSAPTADPTVLCEKCVGYRACLNIGDQSKIGCGSCIGKLACMDLATDATISANSCVGERACLYGSGELRIEYCMDGNKICQ